MSNGITERIPTETEVIIVWVKSSTQKYLLWRSLALKSCKRWVVAGRWRGRHKWELDRGFWSLQRETASKTFFSKNMAEYSADFSSLDEVTNRPKVTISACEYLKNHFECRTFTIRYVPEDYDATTSSDWQFTGPMCCAAVHIPNCLWSWQTTFILTS